MTVRDSAPHSAVDLEKTEAGGVNASARARARESSGDSAQSQPDSAVTFGDWIRDVGALFTPPDIVKEDRPSMRKRWAYASRGEWTARTGVYRRAGQAYAIFAVAVSSVLAYIDWVFERPSRLAAAIALVMLLAQFPPLSWLI